MGLIEASSDGRINVRSIASARNGAITMGQDEMIATLERYKGELEGILSRFSKTHDGIHIDPKDDARFRQLALEFRDPFDDAFVDGHRHSTPLLAWFNDSISNYIGSPSYRGVESVTGVVASALARDPKFAANNIWKQRLQMPVNRS